MEGFMQGSQNMVLERSLLLSSAKAVAGIQAGVEVALEGRLGVEMERGVRLNWEEG